MKKEKIFDLTDHREKFRNFSLTDQSNFFLSVDRAQIT